ncbi:unnamed protein product [Durusdinium trenchii]|uniref:Beta-lactamase-related domain-containing protein n=2 Tax=Durusdinium trenchii TaxID=1381693 RepID=A0ABP0KNI7_9DINO
MVLRRPSRADRSVAGLIPAQVSESWTPLRRRLQKPVQKGQWPGLSACVFVSQRLRLLEEVGYADVEAKIPMTRKTLMRIYSMTKCVVAAAVMQLLEAGQLKLDDELAEHLPSFRNVKVVAERDDGMPDFDRLLPSRRPILIRHLLTHTSGISCGLAPTLDGPRQRTARERAWAGIYMPLVRRVDQGEIKDLAQWVHELAQLPLVSHPGTHYGYGYSYDILGHIIELKSGQKLESYLEAHIFKPLGMRDTSFQLASSPRRLSVLYRRYGVLVGLWSFVSFGTCAAFWFERPVKTAKLVLHAPGAGGVFGRVAGDAEPSTESHCTYTKSKQWGSDGRHFRLVRVDPKKGARSRWAKCLVPSAGGGLSSLEGGLLSTMDDYAKFLLAVTSGGEHCGVRILSVQSAELMMSDLSSLLGSRVPSSARPYDDAGLGLSGIGELQRQKAPSWGGWFDGVPGVRQWGGAASCAFKFDPNKGQPILVMVMTQALPQDDGTTITTLLKDVREVLRL